jgi:flagellar M-ring protein FliF
VVSENNFWQNLTRVRQLGLVVGVLLIIVMIVAFSTWLLRTEYQALFSDLAPQDAATMVNELEKLKTPYRLSNGGTTILVPTEFVHKTRLKLVGKDLPLHGGVGFELFNDSEVGMTEFAQKVNYQRALQGELTRTILSIDDVLSARVHLVLSEQGLFKKTSSQAKASISIATKPGRSLDLSQIQGIQRLVAAAVPDIKANDVTIVNQQGLALTKRTNTEIESHASIDGLDDKRAIEAYLNKKVVDVLERTFGAGQAIASVDVTFNNQNTKTTTENVLGSNNSQGVSAGLIVRERHTMRVSPSDGDPSSTSVTPSTKNPGLASSEVDYQVGRRVEQVVSSSGAVNHINVAVVVRKSLDQGQLERLKDIVSRAVGTIKERGDLVAVYSVDQINSNSNTDADISKLIQPSSPTQVDVTPSPTAQHSFVDSPKFKFALLFLGAIAVLVLFIMARKWRNDSELNSSPPKLCDHEHDKILAQIKTWLATSKADDEQQLKKSQPGGD